MKKGYYFGIFAAFLLVGSIGPVAAESGLMFDYGVAEGDVLEYNFGTDMQVTVSDDSVFTEIDDFYYAMESIEIDSQELVDDLNTALDMDFQVQLTIDELIHESGTDWEEDEIMAKIKMRDDEDDDWVTPMGWAMTSPVFATFSDFMMATMMEDPTAEAIPIGGWYKDTGDMSGYDGPDFDFEGVPLGPIILPTSFSLADFWDAYNEWVIEMIGEDPNAPEYSDIVEIAEAMGITMYVKDSGMAISFSVEDIKWDVLEELIGMPENFVEDEASAMGISSYSGGISFAFEYDENMNLAAAALYLDGSATITLPDTETHWVYEGLGYGDHTWNYTTDEYEYVGTGMGSYLNETIDLPDITDTEFGLSFDFGFAQFGLEPPSEEDIQSGNVGSGRLSSFGAIPGYPVAIVGVFAVSTVVLIIKKRK